MKIKRVLKHRNIKAIALESKKFNLCLGLWGIAFNVYIKKREVLHFNYWLNLG